jgi:hypothetical protein
MNVSPSEKAPAQHLRLSSAYSSSRPLAHCRALIEHPFVMQAVMRPPQIRSLLQHFTLFQENIASLPHTRVCLHEHVPSRILQMFANSHVSLPFLFLVLILPVVRSPLPNTDIALAFFIIGRPIILISNYQAIISLHVYARASTSSTPTLRGNLEA